MFEETMNEIPDPLQQLETPLNLDDIVRQGLARSPDPERWHPIRGWVRMAGEEMLLDGLEMAFRDEEPTEMELESIAVSPITVGFNIDVNDLIKVHGEREASRVIRKLKDLFDDLGIST